MEDRGLVLTDRATLEDVLARRRPDLLALVEQAELADLAPAEREDVRRALVDELCELPYQGGDRRALALLELLRTI